MAKEKIESEVVESEAKQAFRKLLAVYKEQNPRKYEIKKDELEAKLNSL